jgi:hypothetical protein
MRPASSRARSGARPSARYPASIHPDGAPPPGWIGVWGGRSGPLGIQPRGDTIDGELVAKSTGTTSAYSVGDRVFHLKFGNGNIAAIDGNKLTIDFDKAGQKRVPDGFVERVG